MTTPLLRVRGLNVRFLQGAATTHAVRDVSFDVGRGETVALVGESGSGKSVTALSTVGLLPEGARLDGSVAYDGREMIGAPEETLREVRGNDISFIFQEPMTSLNPLHTIEKQLAESIRLHQGLQGAAVRARILDLLGKVGIPDPAERLGAYPHQLSGGQRQRVMIAMALANGPDLLVADEPTTALDVTIQAQILELLADLKRAEGMSLLFITHDLGIVAGSCERMLVLYGGRVMEEGPTDALFAAPTHPYTLGLLAAVPRLDQDFETLPTIAGEPPDMANLPRGCPFTPRCAFAHGPCPEVMPPLAAHRRGPGRRACHADADDVLGARQEALA